MSRYHQNKFYLINVEQIIIQAGGFSVNTAVHNTRC